MIASASSGLEGARSTRTSAGPVASTSSSSVASMSSPCAARSAIGQQVMLDVEHPRGIAELEVDVDQRRACRPRRCASDHGEVGGDHRRAGATLAGERDDHGRPARRGPDLARVRAARPPPSPSAGGAGEAGDAGRSDAGGDPDGLEELRRRRPTR